MSVRRTIRVNESNIDGLFCRIDTRSARIGNEFLEPKIINKEANFSERRYCEKKLDGFFQADENCSIFERNEFTWQKCI